MAAKIEWTAIDYAAKDQLARVIDESGLAYRVIAERMGGTVSHVRIGYIHNGEKSPVRLSEFLAICDVCHADPVQTLRQIIAEAQRIQTEQAARERSPAPRVADITPTDATPALAGADAGAGDAERVARRRELAETAARESRLEEETLRRLEAERAADEMADRIAANPEQFDVAANDDPNKTVEAVTPRE